MMEALSPFDFPVVATLGSIAHKKGRAVVLSSDGHLYVSTGSAWIDQGYVGAGGGLTVDPAVTATGTDAASAYAITKNISVITDTTGAGGVVLPLPTLGDYREIANATSSLVYLYAVATSEIRRISPGGGYSSFSVVIMLPGQSITVTGVSSAVWNIAKISSNMTMDDCLSFPVLSAAMETQNLDTGLNGLLYVQPTANKKQLMYFDDQLTVGQVIQPSLYQKDIALWKAPGNSTTVPGVVGFNAPTAVGTATARNVATTNKATRTKRLGYVSSTTAGSLSGHYSPAAQFAAGNGAGDGGFLYVCRFCFSDAAAVSGARAFVGLSSNVAAPTNVQPNTLTNSIGLAQLSTDATQLYIVYGGSSAQAAIALGTNFPPMIGTTPVLYELVLASSPYEDGVVWYQVTAINGPVAGAKVTGQLFPSTTGVQTPANTTLLAHRAWRCNNATALAVGIDVASIYIEKD